LGFYIFQILGQTNPNEKDYDDKYTMRVRIVKENALTHALVVEGAMKIIKYPNVLLVLRLILLRN
jgi:hypothetical protein